MIKIHNKFAKIKKKVLLLQTIYHKVAAFVCDCGIFGTK